MHNAANLLPDHGLTLNRLRPSSPQLSVGIYRIDTLFHNTTSLTSTAPGTLNSTLSKAGFYVFDVAPEFLAVAILMALNPRRVFATGMLGDVRISDPKP